MTPEDLLNNPDIVREWLDDGYHAKFIDLDITLPLAEAFLQLADRNRELVEAVEMVLSEMDCIIDYDESGNAIWQIDEKLKNTECCIATRRRLENVYKALLEKQKGQPPAPKEEV